MKLRDIAHSRTGDKGDICTAGVIAGRVIAKRHRRKQPLGNGACRQLRRHLPAIDHADLDTHPVFGQRAGLVRADVGD